jgi:hypothetical protein
VLAEMRRNDRSLISDPLSLGACSFDLCRHIDRPAVTIVHFGDRSGVSRLPRLIFETLRLRPQVSDNGARVNVRVARFAAGVIDNPFEVGFVVDLGGDFSEHYAALTLIALFLPDF